MINFNNAYEGAFESRYSFSAKQSGAPTGIQNPNQIGDTTNLINQGIQNIEIGALNQSILEQIPKEHFVEIRRLNKLTGAEASLHAPIQDLDLAGFTQRGWDREQWKENELKLKQIVERAIELSDEGNVPITIHGGTTMAQRWQKEGLVAEGEYSEKELEEARKLPLLERSEKSEMVVVNQETGAVAPLKYEERRTLTGEIDVWTPEKRLRSLNFSEWEREKLQLFDWNKEINRVQDERNAFQNELNTLRYGQDKKVLTEGEERKLKELERREQSSVALQQELYSNMRSSMINLHDRFEKYADESAKNRLNIRMTESGISINELKRADEEINKEGRKLNEFYRKIQEKGREISEVEKGELLKQERRFRDKLDEQAMMMLRATDLMQESPEIWKPVEDFSREKSVETISNTALHAYEKFGEKAPILSIENVYPFMQSSRAKSLRETVEKSREEFAKKLSKEKGLSIKEAEKVAKKIIGVTWDVGHITQLRKYGYSDEEIAIEARSIAGLVKHIHLTDNFGFEDSHLPPGMGTAPVREQMEAIKGFLKGKGREEDWDKIRGIVEAGPFFQTFKESPFMPSLAGMHSPLYRDKLEPYWSVLWDTYGSYMGGMGELMPTRYFQQYGAPGFSNLPAELGGQVGKKEGFAGAPME